MSLEKAGACPKSNYNITLGLEKNYHPQKRDF
jgi:hypothetical protein